MMSATQTREQLKKTLDLRKPFIMRFGFDYHWAKVIGVDTVADEVLVRISLWPLSWGSWTVYLPPLRLAKVKSRVELAQAYREFKR